MFRRVVRLRVPEEINEYASYPVYRWSSRSHRNSIIVVCDLLQPMPEQALLILHPHPLHGGTMGNKVVTTIARVARDAGLPTIAFNFRGVGLSEGVWDHGEGELMDAFHVASLMARSGVMARNCV